MRYENFKIGRVPILTLIGRSKRGLSRRFVTKDSLDSEWDFKLIELDTRLGTTTSEQLYKCVFNTSNLDIIKV